MSAGILSIILMDEEITAHMGELLRPLEENMNKITASVGYNKSNCRAGAEKNKKDAAGVSKFLSLKCI